MSRRVPEFALVTGGFLALTVLGVGVAFTGDLVRSALTAVIVGYPFGLYAVSHSDDPTDVLPPRVVLPAAAVAGASLLVAAVPGGTERLGGRLLYALFAGLVVALPPAAYAVAYGRLRPLPPRPTAAGAAVAGALLLVAGPLAGDAVIGAADALLVFLAGVGYADVHGVGASRRTRRLLVVAGGVFSLLLVGVGLVVGSTTTLLPWVVAAIAAALGPSIHYALSVEQRRQNQNFFNRRS